MKIVVASKNPIKIEAVKEGFEKMFSEKTFHVVGEKVPSGVAEQPMSDEETYQGAVNRTNHIAALHKDADYIVGIEGGVEEKNNELEAFAWVIVCSREGKCGKGRSATFFLPKKVADLIKEGKELGHATDEVFQEDNSKQKQGTIGLLTNNIIDRKKYYVEPIVIALIPFKNPHLF